MDARCEAVDTFIGITGASDAVARRLLEEHRGDLNAAVNSFFSEGDASLPPLQRAEPERAEYMEVDDPHIPVVQAPRAQEPRDLGLPSWGLPVFEPLRSILGETRPRGTAREPFVSEPRDVRQIPINWRDDELPPTRGSNRSIGIQDVSQDETLPQGISTGIVHMEDDSPTHHVGEPYPRRSPERDPFAPQVAEVPSVPTGDVYDVEEEMVQAAIEASKRDAQSPTRSVATAAASEDDEIARAVSLSLKTAEEEKRWRDLVGEQASGNADADPTRTNRREDPASTSVQEADDPEEQPLRRRRSNRLASQQQSRETEELAPSAPQPNGRRDEWAGMSSEEQDEAMMLEAAIFGGISQLPYELQRAVRDFGAEDSAPPRPPSPSVVAQRLLREQQDDEYLASLAADREKELKAKEEAEAASRREREKSRAAEELERQLAAKADSLPPEPASEDDNGVTILVRLPDGSRHGRRFRKSDKLQSLFDFIDLRRVVKPGTYRLVRQYPRRAFTDEEHSASLDSLGLTSKQEALFLETI